MTYIIRQSPDGSLETIDEFNTYREARDAIGKYEIADLVGNYFLSSSCTEDWLDVYESGDLIF